MVNSSGPKLNNRRTLISTTHSIILYGVEILVNAMTINKYFKTRVNVDRIGTLRITWAYRTVSERNCFWGYTFQTVRMATCKYCVHDRDDAKHTCFQCCPSRESDNKRRQY